MENDMAQMITLWFLIFSVLMGIRQVYLSTKEVKTNE